MKGIDAIYIHHSFANYNYKPIQLDFINQLHKERFNFPSSLGYWVGYTFLIEPNGEILQCRKEGEEQAAQKGFNKKSISICLAMDGMVQLPALDQRKALKTILLRLMTDYELKREDIKFHRDVGKTECPGQMITVEYIDNLFKENLIEKLLSLYKQLLSYLK